MNKIISESGMEFGPFNKEFIYEIEKSKLVKRLKIKIVEFVVYYKRAIIFLEAKSSSPMPKEKSTSEFNNFDEYIDEIVEKFTNSVNLFFSLNLKRYDDNMGAKLKEMKLSKSNLKLVLVIRDHKDEWLPPINDDIKLRVKNLSKSCNIDPSNIIVLNLDGAKKKGLVKN